MGTKIHGDKFMGTGYLLNSWGQNSWGQVIYCKIHGDRLSIEFIKFMGTGYLLNSKIHGDRLSIEIRGAIALPAFIQLAPPSQLQVGQPFRPASVPPGTNRSTRDFWGQVNYLKFAPAKKCSKFMGTNSQGQVIY
jgi:hypothetical protein